MQNRKFIHFNIETKGKKQMKTTKKIVSILLALAMVLSLATTAFAYTVTIENDADGHTYEAYQIFDGDFFMNEHTYD